MARRPLSRFRGTALALSLVILSSCESPPAGPDGGQSGSLLLFPAASQVSITQQRIAEITRAVAVALGRNEQLRNKVLQAMKDSPFKEGKLDFGAVIRRSTLGLAEAMAEYQGTSVGTIAATVDSLVPLEIYIPVASHRTAVWSRPQDLVVATALSEEQGILAAYKLSGQSITLDSSRPPTQPTIVLVPQETDFSKFPTDNEIKSAYLTLPGYVNMVHSRLDDLHEEWFMGGPEIEMHVRNRDTGVYFECSGADRSAPYYFDMEGTAWYGSVRVLAASQFVSDTVTVEVWEDDTTACGSGGTAPSPDETTQFLLADGLFSAALMGAICAHTHNPELDGRNCLKVGPLAFLTVLAIWGPQGAQSDDFVGTMSSAVTGCELASIDPARLYLVDEHKNTLSTSYVDLTLANIELPDCALEVRITGDTYACALGQPIGQFGSIVKNGSGDATYSWYEDSVLRGTSPSYSLYNRSGGSRFVELYVTRGSSTRSANRWVDVIDNSVTPNPMCTL